MQLTPDKAFKWLALTLFLGALKLIMFVYDSNPQVFLGDSGSYLATAMIKWIPPDRSFVYGFLVRFLTQNSHSLHSVLAVQTLAGIGTSLLAAVILIRFFNTGFTIAAAVATALTIEPQQLLFERFILTESISTAWFALVLLLTLEYVRGQRLRMLALVQLGGVILIAFRLTFLPVVAITTVAAPLFAWAVRQKEQQRALWQLGMHLALSATLFAGLHSAYKRWNGWLSDKPPAYSYSDGFFLISNVSPLVKPSDTENVDLIPVLSLPLVHAQDPRNMNTRNAEMFVEGGIVQRIQKALKDDYRANVEARLIARRVIFRDPLGFLQLGMQTYLKFYDKEYMALVLRDEAGISVIDPGVMKMLATYHLDAYDLGSKLTITKKYYLASWPFYVLLANTPVALLLCVLAARKPARLLWFLLLITSVHTAAIVILGVEPSPRHLHAATVPLAIGAGLLAARVSREGKSGPDYLFPYFPAGK
jgi:hypothetical protein